MRCPFKLLEQITNVVIVQTGSRTHCARFYAKWLGGFAPRLRLLKAPPQHVVHHILECQFLFVLNLCQPRGYIIIKCDCCAHDIYQYTS